MKVKNPWGDNDAADSLVKEFQWHLLDNIDFSADNITIKFTGGDYLVITFNNDNGFMGYDAEYFEGLPADFIKAI